MVRYVGESGPQGKGAVCRPAATFSWRLGVYLGCSFRKVEDIS